MSLCGIVCFRGTLLFNGSVLALFANFLYLFEVQGLTKRGLSSRLVRPLGINLTVFVASQAILQWLSTAVRNFFLSESLQRLDRAPITISETLAGVEPARPSVPSVQNQSA
jgi:hypothetical protein